MWGGRGYRPVRALIGPFRIAQAAVGLSPSGRWGIRASMAATQKCLTAMTVHQWVLDVGKEALEGVFEGGRNICLWIRYVDVMAALVLESGRN